VALTPITVGPYTVYHLKVSVAANATAELVAASAGQRIMVPSLHIQATPGGTLQFLSALQELTPALPMADTGGFIEQGVAVLPGNILIPVLWTEKSEALNLTTVTSAARGYLKWFYWAE
jgi:hypothetical protein